MSRRRKNEPPDPPPEIMAEAEKLADGGVDAFNEAAEALQRAVEDKDAEAEKHWRQVFDGYTIIVQRHALTMDEWHNVHTAGMYALGDNPRPTPEEQKDLDEQETEYQKYKEALKRGEITEEPLPDYSDEDVPF